MLEIKHLKVEIYVLGSIPYVYILSFLAFYFHAGVHLDRLPTTNSPDPKELPFYSVYEPIVNTTGHIWLFSLFAWLIFSAIFIFESKKRIQWKPIIFSAIGHLTAVIMLFSTIVEWFAD
jgi:hypothetical protein